MYLFIYSFIYLCMYLFIYVCMYLFIYVFIYLCIYLFIYVFIYLSFKISRTLTSTQKIYTTELKSDRVLLQRDSLIILSLSQMIKLQFAWKRSRRPSGGIEVQLYSFFNLDAGWGGWSTPRIGRFTPVKYPLRNFIGRWVCPQDRY